jgi:hypothetical protein
MNARIIFGVNAGVVLAIGLALLVPLALSLLYADGSWRSFLLPAAAMIAAGAAGMLLARSPGRAAQYVSNRDVYARETRCAHGPRAALSGVLAALKGRFANRPYVGMPMIWRPIRLATSSTASSAVPFLSSRMGLISTTSSEVAIPASLMSSMTRCASR